MSLVDSHSGSTNSGLRVMSYNIHKWSGSLGRPFVMSELEESLRSSGPQIVLLQEVFGTATENRLEQLADRLWHRYIYGKNAVYSKGHHGNAVLSEYPVTQWTNHDVSSSRLERRGLLHATLEHPETFLEVIVVHLSLLHPDRLRQVARLCALLDSLPLNRPVIVGGDWNDWRERLGSQLTDERGFQEAYHLHHGRFAKTFPSSLPLLPLDRIYFRGLKCTASGLYPYRLSDHIPLWAEFELLEPIKPGTPSGRSA